ncbi:hypothetical protein BDZ45DRAFT_706354 [Acephala macrosclerotiorum]|nr:hypothetical protein BDZ45DRAFT_706354 [Acephala macrosclerotiorum]
MYQRKLQGPRLKVAIIGAGPAGLGAAIEFSRLPFVDWNLYEQATAIREIGAGISIQPSTWRRLEDLGAAKNLKPEDIYRPADNHSVQHRNGRTGEILVSHLQPGVVRNFAFPDHQISYIGRTSYRTVITTEEIATIDGVPDALYTCPLGDGKFEITTMTPELTSEKEKVSWGQDATIEENLRHFEDFAPVAKAVLKLPKELKQYALFAGPRLGSVIAHGSVALVGDASHRSGAGFALEDVFVLSRAVKWTYEQDLTLQDGLRLFDQIRGPYYRDLYGVLDKFGEADQYLKNASLGFDEAVNIQVEKKWSKKYNWIQEYDVSQIHETIQKNIFV